MLVADWDQFGGKKPTIETVARVFEGLLERKNERDTAALPKIAKQCAKTLALAIRNNNVECILLAGRIGLKDPEIEEALQSARRSGNKNYKLNAICSLLFLGMEMNETEKTELMEMCLVELLNGGAQEAAGRCLRILAMNLEDQDIQQLGTAEKNIYA